MAQGTGLGLLLQTNCSEAFLAKLGKENCYIHRRGRREEHRHSSMQVGWGLAGKSPRYPAGERLGQPQGWLLGAAARGPFGCGQL